MIDQVADVQGVAARWKRQYNVGGGVWKQTNSGDTALVYERLKALPMTASADDVAQIIGNDSWAGKKCMECKTRPAVVELDSEGESGEAPRLCAECCRSLAAFVDAHQAKVIAPPKEDEIREIVRRLLAEFHVIEGAAEDE